MRPRSPFAVLWTSAGTGRRSLSRRLWCLSSVFRSPWPVRYLRYVRVEIRPKPGYWITFSGAGEHSINGN